MNKNENRGWAEYHTIGEIENENNGWAEYHTIGEAKERFESDGWDALVLMDGQVFGVTKATGNDMETRGENFAYLVFNKSSKLWMTVPVND